jgi:conjugal transfer pilus assembly protein TrbC
MARALRERPILQVPHRTNPPSQSSLPKVPNLYNLPNTADSPGTTPSNAINIEALARSANRLNYTADRQESASPVRIFITLDMPRPSLRLLAEQASRGGATLVLRGLKNQSMRQTVAAAGDVLGAPGTPDGAIKGAVKGASSSPHWIIDPQAFERHGITRAPTFAVDLGPTGTSASEPEACRTHCAEPEAQAASPGAKGLNRHVLIAGDVSLAHALQAIAREVPEAAARVTPILTRLQGGRPSPAKRQP